MTPKERFERMTLDKLHVDGCDPDREYAVVLRLLRAAFIAGAVARDKRSKPWHYAASYEPGGKKRRYYMQLAARKVWEGKG